METKCECCSQTISPERAARDLRFYRKWAIAQVGWVSAVLLLIFTTGKVDTQDWFGHVCDGLLLAIGVIFAFRFVDLTRLLRALPR